VKKDDGQEFIAPCGFASDNYAAVFLRMRKKGRSPAAPGSRQLSAGGQRRFSVRCLKTVCMAIKAEPAKMTGDR
jgi:hypothetical protein